MGRIISGRVGAAIWALVSVTGARSGYEYVDPLIGTLNGGASNLKICQWPFCADDTYPGHVFPGATLPFGKSSSHRTIDTHDHSNLYQAWPKPGPT